MMALEQLFTCHCAVKAYLLKPSALQSKSLAEIFELF